MGDTFPSSSPPCIRPWLKQCSVALCCRVVLYTGSSVEPVLELVRCSGDVEVTEGEDAWFDCQLQWTQGPVSESVCVTVSWYKDDDLIPADDEDFKQTFDGVSARLYISGTYLDDAGVYTCTARTSDGRHEASVTATLAVNGLYVTYAHTEKLLNRQLLCCALLFIVQSPVLFLNIHVQSASWSHQKFVSRY